MQNTDSANWNTAAEYSVAVFFWRGTPADNLRTVQDRQ